MVLLLRLLNRAVFSLNNLERSSSIFFKAESSRSKAPNILNSFLRTTKLIPLSLKLYNFLQSKPISLHTLRLLQTPFSFLHLRKRKISILILLLLLLYFNRNHRNIFQTIISPNLLIPQTSITPCRSPLCKTLLLFLFFFLLLLNFESLKRNTRRTSLLPLRYNLLNQHFLTSFRVFS